MRFYRTICVGCLKSDVQSLFTSNFQHPASNIQAVNQTKQYSSLPTKFAVVPIY